MAATILVVDDDNDVRNMLHVFLKADGHSVAIAGGVDAALKLIESNYYDVMLVDKNMPGANGNREGGFDLLRHVRSHSLSSEIIMMTGYPCVETTLDALKLGAFDYMPKPFSLNHLRLKISRVLKYRSFINADYAIGVYRIIRGNMLDLIENGSGLSHDELEQTLSFLNDEIDKSFAVSKESEQIILSEEKALALIAIVAKQLKMKPPEVNGKYALVEDISRLSSKRM